MASIFRKKNKNMFDTGPEAFNLLMKEAVVREFLDEQESNVHYPCEYNSQRRDLPLRPFRNSISSD
jgi:hypothetical protein